MIETILHGIQKWINAATPWLVGTTAGFFLLWLIMLCYKAKPFAKELKWFFGLTPLHKFVVICTVSFFTLWGGSKERGILPSGLIDDISSTMTRIVETVQPRSLPEEVSTNALAITEFGIDQTNQTAYFTTRWATNLFDYTDSRNLYLFSSTNLLERKWTPLCMIPMPADTNAHSFVVTQNDVMPSMRHWFVDTFGGVGFYRFGVDFDSDGDGIADDIETLWTFTDPATFDTDGDGLSDGLELSSRVNTNPLAYDTDGDAVGDGDEVASGSNPRRANSDQDGLSDAQELGAMAALVENDFMWFDMSGGTDLLSGYSTLNGYSKEIPLASEILINEVCYTNARVCLDGTVYLLSPTNVTAGYDYYNSNLSNIQWSASHLAVALCGANLYARMSDWGSKILHGSAVSDGRSFDVVEYRNLGLYDHNDTNELITCQLILPHDETNTVYVSYLCASNTFREVSFAAGIQCGWQPSRKSGERFYNLSWPITADFPQDGLTIKYSIGTCTDPSKNDTDGDGLSDSEEVLTYRTNPLVADTDGDGIPDGVEVSVGTNPRSADTDADGMPDGWEAYYDLNPLVDDSVLDLDNDGLSNYSEYAAGTNPAEADTDEDGIGDRDELGWWDYSSPLPAFSYSNITNLISSSLGYDDDMFLVDLPFEVRFAGYRATKVKVSVNGFVWLVTDVGEVPTSSDYGNQNLSNNTRSQYHGFVAAYWDDLYAYSGRNAQLSVSDAYANGQRYCVIKYQNISIRNDASNMGTFRVVMPERETNTVYVAYDSLASEFNGAGATIGAQSPNRGCNFPVAYNESGSVSNGMVIAYHFGTGSNPLMADTDGDGLEDGDEVAIGTIPAAADTDNDGLSDYWEYQNGLDPLSPSGGNGADGDPDGDHLTNAKEFAYGTDPSSPDTDSDGLLDSDETGCIFVTNAVPWMTFNESEDITAAILSANRRCLNWPTPIAMAMQGETVTNVTISANGLLFFNRAGYVNQGDSTSGESFRYEVDDDALVIAPYLEYTYFRSDIPGYETAVKVGTSTYNGEGYLLVEFDNAFRNTSTWQTNAVSFQVSVPTNHPTCAYVRYKDLSGQYMTGDYASIGMQTFDSRWLHSYCDDDAGKVWENMCLEFLFGANSNPLVSDTDEDGLSDGQEVSIGTSPAKADTDGDELPDNWEVQNSLDPLSAMGDDGASGDPDGDGVDNYAEYELGTNPNLADTDNDGLSDGKEVVRVSFAGSLPWLEISTLTNVTVEITNGWNEAVCWNLPAPIYVQCETVTNITIDKKGIVLLNRSGYADPELWHNVSDLENYAVDTNCFTVVPYGRSLYFSGIEEPSAIKIGTAEHAGRGYIVVEYDNMYHYQPYSSTNAISFQVAIPTGRVERISVSYANRIGNDTDGRSASVGCQSFGAEDRVSYCRNEQGKIYDGMGLSFVVGYGTNPLVADTDCDGISDGVEVNTYGSNPKSTDTDADGLADAQEATLGTALNNPDSDGDGLQDGWEVANSFNPLSTPGNGESDVDTDGDGLTNLQEQSAGSNPRNADSDGDGLSDSAEFLTHHTNPLVADTDGDGMTDKQETDANYDPLDPDMDRDGMPDGWENDHGLDPQDSTGGDGADGDPDNDGLSNIDEYLNGTNPNLPDSDGDGVSDGVEVANGSDPNDASDGGQAPPVDKFREIEFNINGDYAAWEMTIEGLGPDDTRMRKISMGRPNAANTTTLKMRKGNSYRLSMRWLNCDGHHDYRSPWYCWLAQLDGLPSGTTFSSYTNTRREGYEVVMGNGWIADNEDGLLTSHVHECTTQSDGSFGGGNVAGGLTATLYVLDDPKLIPDYDRDGTIGDGDKTKAEQKKVLHFWINDDEDDDSTDGKYAESPSVDIPGARTGVWEFDWRDPDWDDSKVNGYRDLIDFTPVFMDVSTIQMLPEKIRNNISFKLRHDSEAVNVVWTGLSKSSLRLFQRGTVNNCGRNLDESSYEAETEEVESDGIDVPDALAAQMRTASTDKGVAFIEGCLPVNAPLKLDIYYNDQKVVTGELPLHLSSVEEMYRWLNSRGLSGEGVDFPSRLGEPPNRPDSETADRHLVFVHGANVTQDGARGWASEIFKRMWQSGMTAKFTAVTWRSDIGSDANYQENVSNAFFTASVIAQQIKELPGAKVLMAHSLGNMVCSSMIQDYGLVPACYLMCNSAVPAEAYDSDSSLRVPQLVHPEWVEYPTNSWASSWHWLFRNEPNDDRKFLGWPGRFSNVAQYAVNFYSTGDEVLELAGNNNVHTWTGISDSWGHLSWHKQELFKGRGGIGGTDWAGWNIDENIFGVYKISVVEAQAMTEADFKTNTVFYCYPPNMNQPVIPLLVRDAHLAQGIPALTPAAGRMKFQGWDAMTNFDLNSIDANQGLLRPNGWPTRSKYQGQWCHSDLKDVAYFYVFKFYAKAIEKGDLR